MQLTEEEVAADDGHMDYFLLFVGSTQRHLTSTLRSNHDTLQALCPGKVVCPQHFGTSLSPTLSLRGPCKYMLNTYKDGGFVINDLIHNDTFSFNDGCYVRVIFTYFELSKVFKFISICFHSYTDETQSCISKRFQKTGFSHLTIINIALCPTLCFEFCFYGPLL